MKKKRFIEVYTLNNFIRTNKFDLILNDFIFRRADEIELNCDISK